MNEELISALNRIPVADISYDDWLKVGMALKYEGCSVDLWENWSKADSRYKTGECEKKWRGFTSPMGAPATKATIFQIANSYGWKAEKRWDWKDKNIPFGWDDAIGGGSAENEPAQSFAEYALPDEWNPSEQLITYLETLFKPEDIIGYVANDAYLDLKDKKWKPLNGVFHRKAGEIIDSIKKTPNDIGATFGDCKPGAGAWIRFNPLDGKGAKSENVVEFRYALVESDNMSLTKQDALYRRLELPIATLTYSGGKSLHAVVHIDAKDYDEYVERVRYLYAYLEKNGVTIDKQNRNPSRLSRMPGIMRGEKRQQLIETNIGKTSWTEWVEFVEENIDDDLPDTVSAKDMELHPTPVKEALIEGILRRTHKMIVTGDSKSGKSFLLMELAIALSEGDKWLGFQCKQCRVMYINLEIDKGDCQERVDAIYEKIMPEAKHKEDFILWHLRGHAAPLDTMVDKIIRKARRNRVNAVIIDPIYKVITGDENNASEMGNFCRQLDKIADAGFTVIYAHHHSKGAQGGKKAQDRGSGSGVFARDPDAIIDLTLLSLTEDQKNNLADDGAQAMRVQFVLRSFRSPGDLNIWFEYPIHRIDTSGELRTACTEGSSEANLNKSSKRRGKSGEFETAFATLDMESTGHVSLKELANRLEVEPKTAKKYVEEDYSDRYHIEEGIVFKNVK